MDDVCVSASTWQPNLTLYNPALSHAMPVHPGAAGSAAGVATSIAGWFGTKTTGVLSVGAQMDALLAGPKRPIRPSWEKRCRLEITVHLW